MSAEDAGLAAALSEHRYFQVDKRSLLRGLLSRGRRACLTKTQRPAMMPKATRVTAVRNSEKSSMAG
jgi:hypothetical protein